MTSTNFIYDNTQLSTYGLCICRFQSDASFANVSAGSQIDFHLSPIPGKDKSLFLGTAYAETLQTVIQVGKLHYGKAEPISGRELSQLMRWLNRKDGFHKFKLLQKDFENLYALANFNVQKIEIAGKVYGLELSMTTLHPYLLEEQTEYETDLTPDSPFSFYDSSDETGHIYPDVVITCHSDGDLKLTNSLENRTTILKNCTDGEVITLSGDTLTILSSLPSHDIPNDFNYVFPRIANTYANRENRISTTLPCNIRLQWSPIRKAGF